MKDEKVLNKQSISPEDNIEFKKSQLLAIRCNLLSARRAVSYLMPLSQF